MVWGHIFNDGPEHRAFSPYIYDLKDGVPFPVFQNSDVLIVLIDVLIDSSDRCSDVPHRRDFCMASLSEITITLPLRF